MPNSSEVKRLGSHDAYALQSFLWMEFGMPGCTWGTIRRQPRAAARAKLGGTSNGKHSQIMVLRHTAFRHCDRRTSDGNTLELMTQMTAASCVGYRIGRIFFLFSSSVRSFPPQIEGREDSLIFGPRAQSDHEPCRQDNCSEVAFLSGVGQRTFFSF